MLMSMMYPFLQSDADTDKKLLSNCISISKSLSSSDINTDFILKIERIGWKVM